MEQISIQTLARFPFLSEATSAVKELGLSIDELLESLAYRSAWTRAKDRLVETLDFGEIKEHGITTEAECINELLSYVLARIIVSSVKDQFLVRRYALAEAVYAYKELQNKDTKFINDVASQFDLKPLEINDDQIDLNIMDYLKYSISLRDPELKWKLINRDVQDGRVTISSKDLARLIQEAIRIKINDELPIDIEPELNKKIKPRIKGLIESVKSRKKKYETRDLGKVSITRFPPCMKQLLGMTQAGENVSHVGRFALAAFLHHIGLSSDDILVVYSTAPDFDTQKARYYQGLSIHHQGAIP
jgi:DNA primase large subunit